MDAGHPQNADQIAYWNGPGGQRWATRQAAQDVVLQPVLDLLIDRAVPKAGERVVDVGCGSGASTFALAAKVVPAGRVLGVDVSEPMLTRARQSAPQDACRWSLRLRTRPSIRSSPRALIYWPRASA